MGFIFVEGGDSAVQDKTLAEGSVVNGNALLILVVINDSSSNRVAAKMKQSAAFIFLFRNSMAWLSLRLNSGSDDPPAGDEFIVAIVGEILRLIPAVPVSVSESDPFLMPCTIFVDDVVWDCEALSIPTLEASLTASPADENGGVTNEERCIGEVHASVATTPLYFLLLPPVIFKAALAIGEDFSIRSNLLLAASDGCVDTIGTATLEAVLAIATYLYWTCASLYCFAFGVATAATVFLLETINEPSTGFWVAGAPDVVVNGVFLDDDDDDVVDDEKLFDGLFLRSL